MICCRRLAAALACAALATCLLTEPAAATVYRCGHAGPRYQGAYFILGVTSRDVPCSSAKRFANSEVRDGGAVCDEDAYCTFQRWRCHRTGAGDDGQEHILIRCVKAARMIRWEMPSDAEQSS